MKITTVKHLCKSYSSHLHPEARAVREFERSALAAGTIEEHLSLAVRWLFAAQDGSPDDGVCRSYELLYSTYFGKRGWLASYPETTGYIIPTLLNYARVAKDEEAKQRALRMAEWEVAVQLESGAVQGGILGEGTSPAIFNTGQVLFGWLAAFQETQNERFLDAAIRAGTFLKSAQDTDGCWRRATSQYTGSTGMEYRAYNIRTAWAVLLLAQALKSEEFAETATRNLQFILSTQGENGWLPNNCLNNGDAPLLHTIAYSCRGILELGLLLDDPEVLLSAVTIASAVSDRRRADQGFAGRFDQHWTDKVSWSCLTGEAQMAIIWGKLYQITQQDNFLQDLQRTNYRLRTVQLRDTGYENLDGGITGSWPVSGEYGSNEILNWAVKFFIDALLLESLLVEGSPASGVLSAADII